MTVNIHLRSRMRERRRRLSPAERQLAAQRLCRNILGSECFSLAGKVAVYRAFDGEIDPHPVVEQLWKSDRPAFLPVICPRSQLLFAPLWPDSELRANRFGIPEPVADQKQLLQPHQLDLVLAPLVAFDELGNRLGMGGGYYDRSFAFRRDTHRQQKPALFGVAYNFQLSNTLQPGPWDVPMDAIITDQKIYLRHK